MSGIRQNSNPWLADHVLFFGYRWLSWLATALLLLGQGQAASYSWALLATGLLNIPAMRFAQPYVRAARRTPAIMALDIIYCILVLLGSGGWESPFVFYAYCCLALPALLFGWRGGIMAGLSFVSLVQIALWIADRPLADMVLDSQWTCLGLMVVVPPVIGLALPAAIDALRRSSARRRARRSQGSPSFASERIGRESRPDLLRFTPIERANQLRDSAPVEASPALQATKIRATEPGVEDLRRILFAPFPTPGMELAAILDLLSMRFSQHSGVATRVALLGRTRHVHPAHRGVLIRLAQESLLNVQQHAHAASTVLMLRYDSQSVALLIQDDGVGLLDGTYERPGLHALRAMHYRLAELGGRLDVFETEGGGVTVRATMPLE